MDPKLLGEAIRSKSLELGFDLIGMVPVSASKTHMIYKAWLDKGYAGEMAYLEHHLSLKEDVRKLLPETLTLIALAFNYFSGDHPKTSKSQGLISRYAWGDDYHDLIHEKLNNLREFIHRELNLGQKSRGFVDSGPLLEREMAWQAGLGWIGKHSNLIHWEKGSWLFLSEILLDVSLEPSKPFNRVDCGSCRRCIDACPTQAIVGNREVDARRCLSYLTIELKGTIPKKLRTQMGNWIFGCDICQEVCPWNKDISLSDEPGFQARPENILPELCELMRLDDSGFQVRFQNSPVLRSKRRGLLRNVAVALGNWADPEAIPALCLGLNDVEPLVRAHAAWGLGRIYHESIPGILRNAQITEEDQEVLIEITEALEVHDSQIKSSLKPDVRGDYKASA